jgi:tetratricopeptide (TPR) repeat protein
MFDRVAKPTYCVPFLKNRHFVGRRDELAVLRQRLLVDQDCQKMSIVGLGGTGKTQVALQFAYEVKEAQPEWSIFWVPAVSMESFEQACAEIVQALRIPQRGTEEADPKELVKQYLSSSRARRWLLVVDNADDPDILFGSVRSECIMDYLPESEGGVTVYTTRTPEVAELTPGDVIELGAMDWQDAKHFLIKSLVRKDLLRDDVVTAKLLDELLDELTCLPLAIAQAAAYLNKNRMSVSKYLQLLRSTEQDLVHVMSREFRDDTRYKGSVNAVARTWVVSFSQISKHDAVAAELLEFISCVEWKAIPRSLLPSAESEARVEEAIGTLCGYSFLARRDRDGRGPEDKNDDTAGTDDNEEWFDVHRLVHLATRIWIHEYGDLAEVTDDAVRHVAEVFPSDNHANRQTWRAYMPHALRLLRVEQDCDIRERSKLCLWVGRCLDVEGRIPESVTWLKECCRLKSMSEKEDGDLLFAQHELAIAYRADGQVKKAVKLLEAVVKAKETLAADHPDRLASQHELAIAYRADGQVKKAVELLEAVVRAQETLAADHPDRLASQHALAGAYRADGQVKKAVGLLEHVVAVEANSLRDDHPSRLVSVEALADMYAELPVAVGSDETSSSASSDSFTTAGSTSFGVDYCD